MGKREKFEEGIGQKSDFFSPMTVEIQKTLTCGAEKIKIWFKKICARNTKVNAKILAQPILAPPPEIDPMATLLPPS